MGLSSLPLLRDYRSMRASSYDKQGGNHDFIDVGPGEKILLADLQGPAIIRHIWMTLGVPKEDYMRRIVFRIYWENSTEPSVEVPIGDFFGLGHGIRKNFVSAPLQMAPQDGKGFNSYWPMPFRSRARFEVENQGEESYANYFYIDYEKYESEDALDGMAYFHAQWRREADTAGWAYRERLSFKSMYEDPRSHRKFDFEKESYVVLDAKGDGVYVGAHLDVDCFHRNPDDWYGEGDDLVFIDGEERPSIHGTGTEDWCNCAYSPTEEYNSPYNGIILHSGTRSWPWKGKQTLYRYHVEDPIRFKRSILVMIEHGHANGLSNDYSSTAYYYLSRPARGGPEIPPVQERLPRPDEEVYRAER
ncbi:MAG: glycoside hydrolase family 172 protein [Candidatus Marsarchaeota archaeon]